MWKKLQDILETKAASYVLIVATVVIYLLTGVGDALRVTDSMTDDRIEEMCEDVYEEDEGKE
ncbi:MAG: hypothetical protein ACOCV2_02285 [Persicimonas sp.]